LLPDIAQNRDIPQALVIQLAGLILDLDRKLGADRQEGFDAIAALFAKRAASDPIVPLLRARFLIDYAWDARGGEAFGRLTETAKDVFDERIAGAEKELRKALSLDPLSPVIAPLMLTVELAQGRGAERMDSWFRYGVAVDPGNLDLYLAKMHYLEPRWHGSPEEIIAFGRAALETKQWALRTPFIIIFAHQELAGLFENPADYFRADPRACRDVHAVYDPYLALYPNAAYERSGYAYLLYQCGEFDAANRQFQLLGNDGRIGPFLTRTSYENKRIDSAARASAKNH
jgi:hypothetical protein